MEKIFKLYTQRDQQKNCFRYDSEYKILQEAIDAGLRWSKGQHWLHDQKNYNFYIKTEDDGRIYSLKIFER